MSDFAGYAGAGMRILIGTVVDVIPSARCYIVRISSDSSINCSALSPAGTQQLLGPTSIDVYPPDTQVIVLQSTDVQGGGIVKDEGIIIGAYSPPIGTSAYRVLDWVVPFSGADALNDTTQSYMIQNFADQLQDYNVSQPLDAISGSDHGLMNELGVGHGVSRFFSWLRASEAAGLWCFYLDNLVRLSSYNFEHWHAGGERWLKDDEGEVSDVELFSPYPWEVMGRLDTNLQSLKAVAGGGVYKPGQYNLYCEPQADDQTLLPRWLCMRGYLGDMKREMVVLPKPATEDRTTFVESMSNESTYTGVLDVHQHSSGLYSVRSAQGIVLEKYIFIPVPKQMNAPEQNDGAEITFESGGDGATNYAPAGAWGEGDKTDHDKPAWEFSWTDDDTSGAWAAEYYDYAAYMFNWYGFKPLIAHKRDWFIPDSGSFANTTDEDLAGVYVPEERLDDTFLFALPKFASIQIDHRTGDTKYYYSRSVIAQLPDGSILIEDGYGSSIHMTGGNIFISGAGDVWLKPGRSIAMWAGDDIVARAGSSVDITAGNADVRIKAERNLHMLAGNSGVTGGIMLETRSVYGFGGEYKFTDGTTPLVGEDVQTYGMIFRSPDAPIMIYGRDIYGRAVSFTQQGGSDIGGNIEFEADAGMVLSAADQVRYTQQGLTDIIGQMLKDGTAVKSTSVVNRSDVANTVFGSTTLFRAKADSIILDGISGMYSYGPLYVSGGVVPFPSGTFYQAIGALCVSYDSWFLGTGTGTLSEMLTYYYDDVYTSGIKSNAEFMSVAGFTCRNETQYGLTLDFVIPETRWQQIYRAKSLGLLWYEPAVQVLGSTAITRPHPGNAFWLSETMYQEYEPALWQWKDSDDVMVCRDIERGSKDDLADSIYATTVKEHTDGSSSQLTRQFLNTNYLISKQYGQ